MKATMNIVDTFVRIEDKFIVSKRHEEVLLETLNAHMTPSYVDDMTKFSLVESLYFDSHELKFFRDHFSKPGERYKLRIRRYAPNGIWTKGVAFIESKCKADGVCTKERLALDLESYESMMKTGAIHFSEGLKDANKKVSQHKLVERVKLFNRLTEIYHAKPLVSVTYKRHAFEDGDVRVTVDRDVSFETHGSVAAGTARDIKTRQIWSHAQEYGKKYSNEDYVIVEVKHGGQKPLWLISFMEKIGTSETQFSKYCWTMAHLLKRAA